VLNVGIQTVALPLSLNCELTFSFFIVLMIFIVCVCTIAKYCNVNDCKFA